MVQCKATTTKGTRCKHNASDETMCGLCAMHDKKYMDDPNSVVFYEESSPNNTDDESDEKVAKAAKRPKAKPQKMTTTAPTPSKETKASKAREPDDDEMSWNTNDLYNTAMTLAPEVDDGITIQLTQNTSDIWVSIAKNFTKPLYSPPNRKQGVPKKRLTPKLLLNLSLWMFYRDCCNTPNINNVIRNQIIREGLARGALLATKDKVVEENGVIPYQLVKYATDQVWQKLSEEMRQKYFNVVRNDYDKRKMVVAEDA